MNKSLVLPILLLLMLALPTAIHAVEPDEMLADPALEARARAISQEIRCLVCQNQSIDDSNADLARDLRLLVRERLLTGDSDEQVRQFLVDRYGDFVLLRPALRPGTYVLWFGPAVMLVLAIVIIAAYFRRQQAHTRAVDDLTPEERRRVEALLARQESQDGKSAP